MTPDHQTPREWLRLRHRQAQPQLDQLRAAVVAAECGPHASAEIGETNTIAGLLRSLFLPNRAAWTTLVAIWVALLTFHFTRPAPPLAPPATLPQSTVAALLQQLTVHEPVLASGS
jgi:hypothetical protein